MLARSVGDTCDARGRRLTADRRSLARLDGIRCFFRCAVVIDVQCSRFAIALHRSPVSSWLGGQNGEEVKVEDEVRREENGAQDREAEEFTQEEGVTPHRAKRLRNEDCVAFSRRGCHPVLNAPQPPRRPKSTKEASAKSRLAFRRPALNRPQCRCHALRPWRQRLRAAAVKRRGDPAKDGTVHAVRCRHGVDLR